MAAKIFVDGEELTVNVTRFVNNGRKAVLLLDEHGMPYSKATVNLTDEEYVHNQLKYDEVVARNYGGNAGVYQALVDAKIFIPTNQYVKTGFVTVPVCLLNIDDDGNIIDQEGVLE